MSSGAADIAVRSQRVVTPEGVRPATILVADGSIVKIAEWEGGQARAWHDVGDRVVSPGFVDIHVHCNEPGRTEWEGFGPATRAAAAGGTTTLLDMPLNSVPPTTEPAALEAKRSAAHGQAHVDVGFWGGVIPGSVSALDPLVRHGVFGAKCFLTHSGVDEFPAVTDGEMVAAMEVLAAHDRPLLVHAEDDAALQPARVSEATHDYAAWTASRPPAAEARAIERVAGAVRATGGRAHIVHVSSAEGVAAVERARAAGLRLTAETCPHYLALAVEELPAGAVTAKCAPPVRSAAHRDALWAAVGSGSVQAIASDHSPCPVELKRPWDGDLAQAWGGVSSLQVWARVFWTQAAARGYDLMDLAEWTAARPARLAGLDRKGALEPGCDADFVVWDPGRAVTVDPAELESRHPQTAYAGHRLTGRIHTTYVRGRPVWGDGAPADTPRGRLLSAGPARAQP